MGNRTQKRYALTDAAVAQAHDFLKRMPACCDERGYVYLVRSGDLVKIGQTADLPLRMATLQTMSPIALELVDVGRGTRFEGMLHTWFDGSRRHGEWFTASAVMRWLARRDRSLCVSCDWRSRPIEGLIA